MVRTAVIGTGTWGTGISVVLARAGADDIYLWGRREDKPHEIDSRRVHPNLPGCRLPDAVRVTNDTAGIAAADLVLWAVPTPFSAAMAAELAGALPPDVPIVSLAKGIEQRSLRTVTQILADHFGERPYGCISGPTHAEEVVHGLHTGVAAAGPRDLLELLVERIHQPTFRVYAVEDLLGVELCGALKNVIAVAAGICDGLGLGDNTKATLITRGLAEMRRLGRAMGARDATFAGLAGIGDLLTTCYSGHGRNRALGMAAAAGKTAQQYMDEVGMVAEGAWTCRAAVTLGREHKVELPIASQVESVLWAGKPVAAAISELVSRTAKEEEP
ncbi:MAG: NAD(P)H-dependent glycerol-3-phosphate dehydrogenase [Planctomycetota bacterium]